MIIDAKDSIVGRIATVAAKKALSGEKVDIVNCKEAVMTGSKKDIISKYRQRRERGVVFHGPYFPKRADLFVKRTIRGMLPYKQDKGRNAFERIRCYRDIPEALKDKEIEKIEKADISKIPNLKYVSVQQICKSMSSKE